jgi:hypothetical protein
MDDFIANKAFDSLKGVSEYKSLDFIKRHQSDPEFYWFMKTLFLKIENSRADIREAMKKRIGEELVNTIDDIYSNECYKYNQAIISNLAWSDSEEEFLDDLKKIVKRIKVNIDEEGSIEYTGVEELE